MGEVVALHTQRLREPAASVYLDLVARAVRGARLNKNYPDRHALDGTLKALAAAAHRGLYDEIYVDSRSGLPNMASLTRVLTDKSVGLEALGGMKSLEQLDREATDGGVYERLARKRRYYEELAEATLAPVDEHRVFLRRHEPEHSRASFRIELTKLDSAGCYLRVVIELTQQAGLWSHRLVELDPRGEVASGTEALRALVYRFAGFDAETSFIRLHDLDGVTVERVQRAIMGPVWFELPTDEGPVALAEPPPGPLTEAWDGWRRQGQDGTPRLIGSFATDIAAADVREERSNDPLVPLLSSEIRDQERARYDLLRRKHPFAVYKDRKFVASASLCDELRGFCAERGTKNLIYPLR